MDESVLGRLLRSLCAPLRNGHLARFQNRLSDEARCVEAPPRSSNAELMQAIAPLAVILVAAFSDGAQHINTIAGGRDRDELLAWLRNTARHERLERARTNRFNASTV
jgi:hypothetical protein